MTRWYQVVTETAYALSIPPPDEASSALALVRVTLELAPQVVDPARARAMLQRWLTLVIPDASPERAAALVATSSSVAYPAWLAAYRNDDAATAELPPPTLLLAVLPLLSPGRASTDPAWRYLEVAARQLDVPAPWLDDIAGWMWGTATVELATTIASQLDAMAQVSPLAAQVVHGVREVVHQLHADRDEIRKFEEARARCHRLLLHILELAHDFGLARGELEALEQRIRTEAYRLAVLGEFKRGKSTLINALLEQPNLLSTAVLPCTSEIIAVRHGDPPRFERWSSSTLEFVAESSDVFYAQAGQAHRAMASSTEAPLARWRLSVPSSFLSCARVELVDTPGINEDLGRTHAAQCEAQRADSALVVLEAGHLLSLTDVDLLQSLHAIAGNLILVINRADQVEPARWDALRSHVQRRLAQHGLAIPDRRIVFVSSTASGPTWAQLLHELRTLIQTQLFERCSAQRAHVLHQHVVACVRRTRTQIDHLLADSVHRVETFDRHEVDAHTADARHANARYEIETEARRLEHDTALATRVVEALRAVLPTCLAHLKERKTTWTSPHSPIVHPKRHIQDIAQQASKDLTDEIKRWAEAEIAPMIDRELRGQLESLATRLKATFELLQDAKGLDPTEIMDELSTSMAARLGEHTAAAAAIGSGGILFRAGLSGAMSSVLGYVVADAILYYVLGIIGSFVAWPLLAAAAVLAAGMFRVKGDAWVRTWVRNRVFDTVEKQLATPELLDKLTASIQQAVHDVKRDTANAFRAALAGMLDELSFHRERTRHELQNLRASLGTPEAIRQERNRRARAAAELHAALNGLEHAAAAPLEHASTYVASESSARRASRA